MQKDLKLNVFDKDLPYKIQDIETEVEQNKKRCKYGADHWKECQYHVRVITPMLSDIERLKAWAKMKGIPYGKKRKTTKQKAVQPQATNLFE
jgi:predicted DNA binding CopG/RHH family protein